jgi:hypothetical protein
LTAKVTAFFNSFQETEPTVIKLVDKAELMRERKQKKDLDAAKTAEKDKKRAEAAAKLAALEEQKKIPPSEMFNADSKYSKFDEKVGTPPSLMHVEVHLPSKRVVP